MRKPRLHKVGRDVVPAARNTVPDAALTMGKSGKTLLEEMDYDELVELVCQMGLTVKDGESRAELLSEIIKCAVEHESKQ